MPRPGKRTRIAEGIYRDAYGLAAVVKVGNVQREKRWPLGTDLKPLKAWRETERVRLRAVTLVNVRGSFSSEARRYLTAVKGTIDTATFKSRRSEVRAWAAQLGGTHIRQIDTDAIRQAISAWREDDKSPKTIQNRVRTLGHLWRTLYKADPPIDGIDLPIITKRRPAFVKADTITAVEAQLRAHEANGQLPDSKTRARFMVIASTGMRPAQLKRMRPEDVDLERRVALIPGAKGGEPVGLYLNDDMLTAWSVFVAVKAWGRFDTRSWGRVLRHAGWPAGVRPYNARHAVGIELGERGVDFRVIADFLGHTDDKTTRAFYVPVLNSRLRDASELLAGRLGWLAEVAGTAKTKRKPKGRLGARKAS